MASTDQATIDPTAALLRRNPGSRDSRRWKHGDRVFNAVLGTAALIAPALVVLFLAVLIYGAWPSIHQFGWRFLFSREWDPNPDHEEYGALVFIVGTLI